MCNRIREIMDERGLKPTPFARSIDVKTSTMFSIYRGQVQFQNIAVGNFLKIAHGLGMTAEELYYGTKPADQTPTYSDPRQRDINDAYESVNEDGKRAMYTNAVMARTTFPDEVERDSLLGEVAE